MKKVLLVVLAVLIVASMAFGQNQPSSTVTVGNVTQPANSWTQGTPYAPGAPKFTYANPTGASGAGDVLGAHNGYGRGCVMCHVPHSGGAGNNNSNGDAYSGVAALWGQDVSPLYNATIKFGDNGNYAVTLPAQGAVKAHDATTDIMFCLSCHDGSVTKVGMMQNQTVETLPIVGGHAPTLLGNDGSTAGNYLNDHPVGPSALVGCGGYDWDCNGGAALTGTTSVYSVLGTQQKVYMTNYPASIWNNGRNPLATLAGNPNAVTCTTCHDQHSMTVYSNSNGSYPTMFFIKGQYTPNKNGNSVAQFCRNCHGGESNEMHGLSDVPTI